MMNKIRSKKFWIFLLMAVGLHTLVYGKVRLPALVGDNMVLQQNSEVNIWGWSKPEGTISLRPSWGEEYQTKADEKGNWNFKIKTPAASLTPVSITVSDGEERVLNNVMIGEVWLCSGQSNMQIEVQGGKDCPIENAQQIIVESARYRHIRLFTVGLNGTLEKQTDVTGCWQTASPAVVKKFSAVGYLFGLYLHQALNVPVGIINSSCGGTWIEAWLPAEAQKKFDDFDPESVARKEMSGFNTAEILYNGMIYPLHNYAVKGFCWYQGESNVGRGHNYGGKLTALIDTWRTIWGGDRKPFYYVEIAPFNYGDNNLDGALLREQQKEVMAKVENTGMVCTNDLVYAYEKDQIHPTQKETIARRLSYWALSKDYGYGDAVKVSGPAFRSMEITGDEVKVIFDGSNCGFIFRGKIEGFELAGRDGIFYPAQAVRRRPDATVLYVSSYAVAQPVAVRYCFKNFSPGKLWDAFGQPVIPFRSDVSK